MSEATAATSPAIDDIVSEDWGRRIAVWAFIALLAWAPFPLGSNRPWSWNLLILLIAACWIAWGLATWEAPQRNWALFRRYPVSFGLAVCAICWSVIQALPVVPPDWAHPAWNMASAALGHALPQTISINPWHTLGDCLKLCSYVMAFWLAYAMARRTETATRLLDALIAIGTAYGLYSAVLKLTGFSQFELFYDTKPVFDPYFTGPFVLHNSYATFAGLTTLAAVARLVALGQSTIVTSRGLRQALLATMQFLYGRGIGFLLAFLISFSTLLASASRAGFLATICGLAAMLVLASFAGKGRAAGRWSLAAVAGMAVVMLGLVALSGDTLASRLNDLVDAGGVDSVRLVLWDAARRMIGDAPFLGLGLGTFSDAYPLYASQVLPFTMDKAHNDYLEFSAGLGLPAAIAWWAAWFLLVLDCAIGSFRRRRNRHFAILAVGASVLVAVHSAFDFSLQIPAVSLLYATILGIGLAQARSSQSSR